MSLIQDALNKANRTKPEQAKKKPKSHAKAETPTAPSPEKLKTATTASSATASSGVPSEGGNGESGGETLTRKEEVLVTSIPKKMEPLLETPKPRVIVKPTRPQATEKYFARPESGSYKQYVWPGIILFVFLSISFLFFLAIQNQEGAIESLNASVEGKSTAASDDVATSNRWMSSAKKTSQDSLLEQAKDQRASLFKLSGITSSNGEKLALINNQVVAVGDHLKEGAEVQEIKSNRVLLEFQDSYVELVLH